MLHILQRKHHNVISMTLIITIFILFVVSLATQLLTNIAVLNLAGSKQIILSTRATQAAKSGIEWALVTLVNNNSCFSPTTLTINEVGLNELTVYVSCDQTDLTFKIYAQAIHGEFGSSTYTNKIINLEYSKEKIANLNLNLG